MTDRFHVAKKFNEVVDSLRKNITREYKAKLTKDQRKAFRSQMWAFRRDPESLSAEESKRWRPSLRRSRARPPYKVRLRFKEIFDTVRDRITASCWLRELRRECGQLGLDLGSFFETYDRWKTKILNYFDARQRYRRGGRDQQQGPGDHQAYLWTEVSEESVGPIDPGLELGVASDRLLDRCIRQMAKGLKALFDWSCT